mgnify:CR=1 FL=1
MEPTKFRQVNEALDWVFEAPKKDQVDRLKTIAKKNQTIVPFVRWGVGAEKVEWGLPEGMPETTKIKDDIRITIKFIYIMVTRNGRRRKRSFRIR